MTSNDNDSISNKIESDNNIDNNNIINSNGTNNNNEKNENEKNNNEDLNTKETIDNTDNTDINNIINNDNNDNNENIDSDNDDLNNSILNNDIKSNNIIENNNINNKEENKYNINKNETKSNDNNNNDNDNDNDNKSKLKKSKPKPLLRSSNTNFVSYLPTNKVTRLNSEVKKPRPLARTNNFVAYLPTNNIDQDPLEYTKSRSISADHEEKQILQTLVRIRQKKRPTPLNDAQFKTTVNLWDALNQRKATIREKSHTSDSDIIRQDTPPKRPQISRKNSSKLLSATLLSNNDINTDNLSNELATGRHRNRNLFATQPIPKFAKKIPETHGFMQYVNEEMDDKEDVKEIIDNLSSPRKHELKRGASQLFLSLEKRAQSNLEIVVKESDSIIRDRSHTIDRKSLKLGSLTSRKLAQEHKKKLFEICSTLRGTSSLVNSIYKKIKNYNVLDINDVISSFTKNVPAMIPDIDTLIEEISPSYIRTCLWNDGLYNNPQSMSFMNFIDLEFSGDVYMMGSLYLNHEFTIIEHLGTIISTKKKFTSIANEYVKNVIDASNGNTNALEYPRPFPLQELVKQVFSGTDSTVLITESGGFYVIGSDFLGGLCIGKFNKISFWTGSYYIQSFQGHNISKVACGAGHFIALTRAGDLFSWGANCFSPDGSVEISYQLGHSPKEYVSMPKEIFIEGFAYDVDCGHTHSVVLSTLGIYTFGTNNNGELGREQIDIYSIEIIPESETWSAVKVACGKHFTLILTNTMKLYAWGANDYGQISSDINDILIKKPILVDTLNKDIIDIACGFTHSLACTRQGELYAWGSNILGELGFHSKNSKNKIALVPLPESCFICSVSCGGFTSAAITSQGQVYSWGMLRGSNFTHHQTQPRLLENSITNSKFISSVSCGVSHLFILEDSASTSALGMFKTACVYEGWYKSTQMRLTLLSLPDPVLLIKSIQDRAISSIRQSDRSRPFITFNNAYHSFYLSHDSDVLYHTFNVQNLSNIKIKIAPVIDSFCLSNSKMYKISVMPESLILPKNASQTITIVLKCLKQPPNVDASALFYFIVQPDSTSIAINQISRYFIMCDIIPPLDSGSSTNISDLADVVHTQYENAKQSIKVLKTFIPNSLLNYFSIHIDPPKQQYCETFKASVIFLDVSGFTMLTARMAQLGDVGPEMISNHLNNYFGALIDTAARFGGELVKSAGDAIMCVFRQQPNECDIDFKELALRSVQCGLEIQQSHSIYDSGQGFTLSLHIGIGVGNMSLMFVGGVNNQWMHIVAGDPLSQLSTCVDGSNSGEVVVSKFCYNLIKDDVYAEPRNNDYLILKFNDNIQLEEQILIDPNVPVKAEPALRCFIHPAILPSLENNDWQLDELRRLTSIFIKLSTDNFNSDNPDLYCSSLQEAFTCMQENIIRYEGLICQFLQDDKGVIFFASFGVPPYSHVDDPLRAVRAGVDIYNGLAAIGVPCSVGVYTGFVFTGVIGSKIRHDYTVLGDAVNMAARLMGKAYQLGLGVLCGKDTYEACGLRIQFEILEPVLVKGKNEPIHIYRPKLSQTEQRLSLKPTAYNIIGRSEEKLLLTNYLIELKDYYSLGLSPFLTNKSNQLARTIILEGPPGIGKTFLAKYLVRVAKQLNLIVAFGVANAVHQITPYYIWRSVLESLYGITRSPSQLKYALFIQNLRKIMSPRLVNYLPLLQSIVPQLPFTSEQMKSVESLRIEERNNYINEIIHYTIEHESSQIPVVIILEDIQWIDASSLTFLNSLASTIHNVLVIGTSRELTDTQRKQLKLLSLKRTENIILQPLSDNECTQILVKHMGVEALPRELKPLINQVQGNPLYCEELAYGILSRKLLESGRSLLSSIDLPDSVEGLISSRLDLQPPSAQTLLKVASVIGFEFELGVLQGVYKGKIGSDIKLLQSQNFIQQYSPSSYIFRSEVVCRVAYSRLLVYKRKELHKQIAEWYEALEKTAEQETLQYNQLLAYHWYEALDGQDNITKEAVDKVITYMRLSADIAAQLLAVEEAAAILQRGLRFLEPLKDDIKVNHEKRLKLQLMGLPVRNLHGFSMKDTSSKKQNLLRKTGGSARKEVKSMSATKPLLLSRTSAPENKTDSISTSQAHLQGILKRKVWAGRWKSVYCVIKDGLFSLYGKSNKQKLKEEFPLQLVGVRIIDNESEKFSFCISRRNQSDFIFSALNEVELQHWVDAISSISEVPALIVNVYEYIYSAMVITSATGKIEAFNTKAESIFGLSKTKVLGLSLKVLIPNDKQIHKFLKCQTSDIVGKPKQVKCFGVDNTTLELVACFGEFTQNGMHKIIVTFRYDIELSDEVKYIVDQEFRILADEEITRRKSYANNGGKPLMFNRRI